VVPDPVDRSRPLERRSVSGAAVISCNVPMSDGFRREAWHVVGRRMRELPVARVRHRSPWHRAGTRPDGLREGHRLRGDHGTQMRQLASAATRGSCPSSDQDPPDATADLLAAAIAHGHQDTTADDLHAVRSAAPRSRWQRAISHGGRRR